MLIFVFVAAKNLLMKIIKSHKGLIVYQMAFKSSMDLFILTKSFPKEEVYSLTSQIRRSSHQCQQILPNLLENGGMKKLLFQNYQIVKQKQLKCRFGSIIH